MSERLNVIFIGKKPTMSYVLAVMTAFTSSNAKEITLKARGMAITTAEISLDVCGFIEYL